MLGQGARWGPKAPPPVPAGSRQRGPRVLEGAREQGEGQGRASGALQKQAARWLRRGQSCGSRRCLRRRLTAKVRGAPGSGREARGGEAACALQITACHRPVCMHPYKPSPACVHPCTPSPVHTLPRARPRLCPAHVPGAVQELPQPSGPARRSQPDTRHVPACARGHACSYVLRLLTLSALINTSGEAGGR